MLDTFSTLMLGIVEGVTEFLPISSTGHLILASKLLGLQQTDFLKSFEITIQLGAILSVIVLYWRSLALNSEILKRIIIAFLPTAVIGFVLYKFIKGYLLENDWVVVWALLVGGVLLIVFELGQKKKQQPGENDLLKIPLVNFFWVGTAQALSVIPGVSRSASTILGGMLLGFSRRSIVEFSFLLAVPTMLAASGYDLLKSSAGFEPGQLAYLAAGFIVSFITALFAIKFLLDYIKKHTFIAFGAYRIAVAVLYWLAILG